jgi:hypothetical protein
MAICIICVSSHHWLSQIHLFRFLEIIPSLFTERAAGAYSTIELQSCKKSSRNTIYSIAQSITF